MDKDIEKINNFLQNPLATIDEKFVNSLFKISKNKETTVQTVFYSSLPKILTTIYKINPSALNNETISTLFSTNLYPDNSVLFKFYFQLPNLLKTINKINPLLLNNETVSVLFEPMNNPNYKLIQSMFYTHLSEMLNTLYNINSNLTKQVLTNELLSNILRASQHPNQLVRFVFYNDPPKLIKVLNKIDPIKLNNSIDALLSASTNPNQEIQEKFYENLIMFSNLFESINPQIANKIKNYGNIKYVYHKLNQNINNLEPLNIAIPQEPLIENDQLTEKGEIFDILYNFAQKSKNKIFYDYDFIDSILQQDDNKYVVISKQLSELSKENDAQKFIQFIDVLESLSQLQLLNTNKAVEFAKQNKINFKNIENNLKKYAFYSPDNSVQSVVLIPENFQEIQKKLNEKVEKQELKIGGMVHELYPKYLKELANNQNDDEFPLFSFITEGGPGPQGRGFTYRLLNGQLVAICTDLAKTKLFTTEYNEMNKQEFIDKIKLFVNKNKVDNELNTSLNGIIERAESMRAQEMASEHYDVPVNTDFSELINKTKEFITHSKLKNETKQKTIDSISHLKPMTVQDHYNYLIQGVANKKIAPNIPAEVTSIGEVSHQQVLQMHSRAINFLEMVKIPSPKIKKLR